MFHRVKADEQTTSHTKEDLASSAKAEQKAGDSVSAAAAPAQISQTVTSKTTAQVEEKKMSNREDQDKQNLGRSVEIPAQAGGFHQAGQPRVPGAYNSGAYTGAGASAQGGVYGSSSTAKVSQGRRLVIGQGITMSGEIEACDYLVVEGAVEAALKGASVLEIAETGIFYGTVEIDEATVAGRFEGDIKVNGRLTITATGSITGSIAYKELAVESGATVDGKISPLSVAGASAAKKGDSKPKIKEGKPRNDNAGEEGSELPFSGNAAAG